MLRKNIDDILTVCAAHSADKAALVVFDQQCVLAPMLTDAYRACLPSARFLDFDKATPDAVLSAFAALARDDLVVLIQSTSFRLVAFRIRVELFKRGLKVIEHPHLDDILPTEVDAYVDSLAYDPSYYRAVGPALKARMDRAEHAVIDSGGERLSYASGFEPAKLNIGDYTGMPNVGGQFPIGEVFTEAKDLARVNGRVRIFAFGDTAFRVNAPHQPVTLVIQEGRVTNVVDTTDEFDRVIAQIRADEGEVWVRELGFGLNRALTRERRVSAIGTYERMCGVHVSLGSKHGVYNKPNFRRKDGKYHVDVFAVTEKVSLDGETIFQNGGWTL